VPREDPMTLLAAFVRLHKMVPDAHLVLVGDGELRGTIEDEITNADLREFVHLPGYLPYSQLPLHYSMADIFVHPAAREQWGVSVNEAMVCGVPVIAAHTVGAAKDLIKEGESGCTYAAGDSQALAQQLFFLAGSGAKRKEIAENARKRIQQWHYRETANQLEAALKYVETFQGSHNKGAWR